MAELTKRETLTICLDLWTWLAKHPDKDKSDWPGWEKLRAFVNDCPCCEYHTTGGNYRACGPGCLVSWEDGSCGSDSSSYQQWYFTWILSDKVKYALQIVQLVREALNRLEVDRD